MVRSHRLSATVLALVVLLTASACTGPTTTAPGPAPTTTGTGAVPPPARQGREAPGARTTFVPVAVLLPDGTRAPVEAASTREGVLEVPEEVDRVGWWDGSALVGDPFGSTVLAGHVDSAAQGLGVLARLRSAVPGDLVTVEGESGASARYRVVTVEEVPKTALATTGAALDQDGAHRLVLITCTGRFDPVRRSYDDNLVVTAVPDA